jgi:hypothetical protein
VVAGDPIMVPEGVDTEDYILKINQAINRADEKAEALLKV